MSIENYDFSGWVTKANIRCSDGRTIMKNAFAHNDGQIVPLVWNHQHDGPDYVLGQVLLENRDEGVYGYGKFNETEAGKTAKLLVQHGDVDSLSIYANQLKESMSNVIHGNIREVSLVLAGANIGAHIDNVIAHGEESNEEAYIFTGEDIMLSHGEEKATEEDTTNSNEEADETEEVEEAEETKEVETTEETKEVETTEEPKEEGKPVTEELMHADAKVEKETEKKVEESEETVADVFDTLTEKQKTVVYALIGQALEDAGKTDENEEGDDSTMKHNVFEQDEVKGNFLTHADQENIINLAKTSGVGSLKAAMKIYAEQNSALAHSFDDAEALFPDYVDVVPGAPGMIERDRDWVDAVLKKAHKSPASRVRTRHVDARVAEAKGHKKGNQKELAAALKALMRTTDPQTVYYRDNVHRDDVLDMDFDVIGFQRTIMKHNLEEKVALAALIGDGLEDTDADKISEDHIRSIWNDDENYTIRATVDIEAARNELQGTNTAVNFGDNFVYAEAVITAAMYARENYKGKGKLDFFCSPHLLNVMLLARDLNGRRIYESKEDLAKVLNVNEIHEVEGFEGRTREDAEGNTKKLLGIFVNMANYQFGCTKGGEITNFEDFDLDFNTYKFLMETRLSGALINPYSAIALEEAVTDEVAG